MTMVQAVVKLDELALLTSGWNSYDAKPINPKAIHCAKAWLWRLGDGWSPVPGSDGSVSLVYNEPTLGVNVEAEIIIGSE